MQTNMTALNTVTAEISYGSSEETMPFDTFTNKDFRTTELKQIAIRTNNHQVHVDGVKQEGSTIADMLLRMAQGCFAQYFATGDWNAMSRAEQKEKGSDLAAYFGAEMTATEKYIKLDIDTEHDLLKMREVCRQLTVHANVSDILACYHAVVQNQSNRQSVTY